MNSQYTHYNNKRKFSRRIRRGDKHDYKSFFGAAVEDSAPALLKIRSVELGGLTSSSFGFGPIVPLFKHRIISKPSFFLRMLRRSDHPRFEGGKAILPESAQLTLVVVFARRIFPRHLACSSSPDLVLDVEAASCITQPDIVLWRGHATCVTELGIGGAKDLIGESAPAR